MKALRLGVIGDVHGELEPLERAVDALEAAGVDTLACVGDVYGPGKQTSECCKLIQERQILTVRGNHDRWVVEAAVSNESLRATVGSNALDFLCALPITLRIETASGPALLCHGVGANDLAHVPQTFARSFVRRCIRIGVIPPQCTVMVHGHSHLQRHQVIEGILFVTVGALRFRPASGCLIIDTASRAVLPISY
jgi:putative phosphoesterase